MATPEEIRKVPRPRGTVIKTVGEHHYVVKRTCIYKDKRRVPVDLETLGKIIDFQFVPTKKKVKNYKVETKDYGNVFIADMVAKPILQNLRDVFEDADALKIYTMAVIRAAYGNVTNRDVAFKYETSFMSEFYKVSLSKQTISEFLPELGKSESAILEYMCNLIKGSSDMIIVDGMLKNNNSNTIYSQFSRKGKVKGSKDFSLLYALDFNTKEPIAFTLNQGNMLDKISFQSFLKRFNIKNSIIVGDKGFELTDETRKEIADHNGLRYLIPIKRNRRLVETLKLLDMKETLKQQELLHILGKKESVGGIHYYAFRDSVKQGYELKSKLETCAKKSGNVEDVLAKKETYGTIIFESNLDVDLDTAYAIYDGRWEIETMFNFYKNIIDIKLTNVHSEFSMLATEFINFLSVIIGIKLKKLFVEKNLLGKYSQKQLMEYLQSIRKSHVANGDEWNFCTMIKYVEKIGIALGVV